MALYEDIIKIYPELSEDNGHKHFGPYGTITLRNDSDGLGDYIERWDYSKPVPKGMKIGK